MNNNVKDNIQTCCSTIKFGGFSDAWMPQVLERGTVFFERACLWFLHYYKNKRPTIAHPFMAYLPALYENTYFDLNHQDSNHQTRNVSLPTLGDDVNYPSFLPFGRWWFIIITPIQLVIDWGNHPTCLDPQVHIYIYIHTYIIYILWIQTLSEKVLKPPNYSKWYPKHFLRRYNWIYRLYSISIHIMVADLHIVDWCLIVSA